MGELVEDVESTVLLDNRQKGSVVVMTLNRPHVMNAMSTEMGIRLNQVLDELAERPRVRAVILTGAGERAFCTGGDLKQPMGMTPEQWQHQHRVFESARHRFRGFPKPIFAAVNGVAAGGGGEMAMSTDFIICSENARFGQPEVSRGIMPGSGGTVFLPRYLPRGRALELLMTAELIDAQIAPKSSTSWTQSGCRWCGGARVLVQQAAEPLVAKDRAGDTFTGGVRNRCRQAQGSMRPGSVVVLDPLLHDPLQMPAAVDHATTSASVWRSISRQSRRLRGVRNVRTSRGLIHEYGGIAASPQS